MRRTGRAAPSRPPAPRSRRLRASRLPADRPAVPGVRVPRDDDRPADHEGLVAGLDHELRTPLTMMVGWTEVLRSGAAGELTPEQQRMVSAVERGAARVEDLVTDLLVLAADAVASTGCPCRTARTAYAGSPVADAARRLASRTTEAGDVSGVPA